MDNRSMMKFGEELNEKFDELVKCCMDSGTIDLGLYTEYDVKRGLRDSNGHGVLTGLTEISDVIGMKNKDGHQIPCEGELYYQGYNVKDLVESYRERRYAFEEVTYLLLFGQLPTGHQLASFRNILSDLQVLSAEFSTDVIMKAPSANIMNALQKCVLTLYSYDDNPDDISIPNVLLQSLRLISKIPVIAVYAYHAYRHMRGVEDLCFRAPDRSLSMAENILQMLRPDGRFTELEAKVLDIALVLHAEHGGGNNSTFTDHVVTSSGTDTYSAISASIASLKGPRHGGANLKVLHMFDDLKANCPDWSKADRIREYLEKILNGEAFDGAGLIYGMGHAVYTDSDPREVILKEYAKALAEEKGQIEEFELYEAVENMSRDLIMKKHRRFKPVCANVDFYSGFVYTMLGIPREMFTPIFAIARIPGWSAHRLEELVNKGKIIRPAYKYVGHHREFCDLPDRKG